MWGRRNIFVAIIDFREKQAGYEWETRGA